MAIKTVKKTAKPVAKKPTAKQTPQQPAVKPAEPPKPQVTVEKEMTCYKYGVVRVARFDVDDDGRFGRHVKEYNVCSTQDLANDPKKIEELRVDGGASANRFLLEFQSDLLGIPVVRPSCIESTAFGAAALAGIGVGYYSSQEEVESLISEAARFEPKQNEDWRNAHMNEWEKAVKRSLCWID